MGDGEVAMAVMNTKRLDVGRVFGRSGGRISVVTDGLSPSQCVLKHVLIIKNRKNKAKIFVHGHHMTPLLFVEVRGDDACRFLPPVLKCVQSVVGEQRGIRVVKNAENAAIIVWFIDLHEECCRGCAEAFEHAAQR